MNVSKSAVLMSLCVGILADAPAHAAGPVDTGPVDKAACLDAVAKGQRLRDTHKLAEARDKFRLCARAECPAVLQTDCANWLADVERTLPTVVLSAKDGRGRDLVDVKVSADDRLLATTLDGQAVPIDPGLHTFLFENVEGRTLKKRVLIVEGSKAERISVVFGSPEPTLPVPGSVAGLGPSPAEGSSSSVGTILRVTGVLAGVVGLGALGIGVGIAVDAKSKDSSAANEPGAARKTESASAVSEGNIATVVFSVGAGLAVTGLVVWLAAPSGGERRASAAPPRSIGLFTDGRQILLGGSF